MTYPCVGCNCRVTPNTSPVYPVARGKGKVVIVADAPTGAEALGRSYFNGAAGEVMEATIRGVARATGAPIDDVMDEVAIVHAVARPTPGGKPPGIAAVRNCRGRLLQDLADLEPRMVLSVGAASCAALSGTGQATPITKWRGMMRWLDLPDGSRVPWVASISPGSVVGKPDYYRDLAYDVWKAWTQTEPLAPPDVEIVVPRDAEALRVALARLDGASVVACDVETTSLRAYAGELLSVGYGADFGDGAGLAVIVPFELLGDPDVVDQCWAATYTKSRRVVFQNGKFDLGFLMRWFGETSVPEDASLGDTLYLGSLLDERPRKDRIGSLGLKEQAMVRYDEEDYHWSWDEFYNAMRHDGVHPDGKPCVPAMCQRAGWSHPDAELRTDWDGLYHYHALDVHNTARLWFDLVDEANAESPRLMDAHDDVIVPAMRVLAACELRGAPLDADWLYSFADRLRRRISRLEAALVRAADRLGAPDGFEHGSAAQVASLMYDVWEMTPDTRKKKYKDGVMVEDRSTDKKHIDGAIAKYLRGPKDREARWLRALLRLRADQKQLSTYSETLLEKADDDARVHAEFLIHGTTTGRLSSANPNLQNIPAVDDKKLVNGRMLYQLRGDKTTHWPARRGFAAPPGYLIAEVDYGQLELRIAAALSGDEAFAEVFRRKRDIHREVAATMFSKPPEEITKPERYLAKAVDFGILYGRQGKAIAEGEEMDFYERELGGRRWDAATADAFVAKFLRGYPKLATWLVTNGASAVANYYVESPLGRRRRFPFKPRTKWERMRIERQANNTPVQATASDLCLQAMARIEHRLPDGAVLLFPVHDSIVVELRADLVKEVERVCRKEMEIEFMGVPLEVDFEVGESWADVR